MTSNPDMTWDEASISAGISMSYSFNPGWDAQRRQSMPNDGSVNYSNGQYYGTEPVAFTNSNKAMNSNLLASNSKRGVYSDSEQRVRSSRGGATVYVENDGIGHVYLEVNGSVFSYGRYDGSYSHSSGAFGPVGNGV